MNNQNQLKPVPKALKNAGDSLVIEWDDGLTQKLRWQLLRDNCPCATCKDKHGTPPPTAAATELLPVITAAEAQPIKAAGMQPVGNYAYAIEFNDGHNTGIYTFEYLRELGEIEKFSPHPSE